MKYAMLILVVAISNPVLGDEDELICFDIKATRSGETENLRYIFSKSGIVIRTDLPWNGDVKTLTGIFRYEEKNNWVKMSLFRPQKKLEPFEIETLKIDTSTTPLTFSNVGNTEQARDFKILSANKVNLSEAEYKHLVGYADRVSEIFSQHETRTQLQQDDQIQLMLEYHDGMKRSGWEFAESFAAKLGL